ncbi:MAG: acetylglutamate kinase [Coriobacteriia bacterium]|nr:acetylglutamate kinase [Coriobacteriia bacterium]
MKAIATENRAEILIQALPYIQQLNNKVVVVKYGGNAMIKPDLIDATVSDLVLLSLSGVKIVVVHGGGPFINETLDKLGIQSQFIDGLRYTSAEVAEIVQMVLAGKVGKDLVNQIQERKGRALGICGLDGDLFVAKRLQNKGKDYGFVGDIVEVNTHLVKVALEHGYIPVISSLAASKNPDEKVLNINADIAASKLAAALGASKLILLTDVKGLLADKTDENTLISTLKVSEISRLKKAGVISSGMIPKIDCCVEAIRRGVERAHIIDGRIPHSMLIEMLSDEGIGTMIY